MESTPAVKGQAPIVGSEVIFIHTESFAGPVCRTLGVSFHEVSMRCSCSPRRVNFQGSRDLVQVGAAMRSTLWYVCLPYARREQPSFWR
jgi:hypothetical protein